MKKLHKLQIISKLVVTTPLTTIGLLMRNFIANFVRILGIRKDFAGNRVNELGNVPRCGVVPKFSDLCTEFQKNLLETASITLEVPFSLNQKNWRPPSWAYKRFRKRIETIFSQVNDNLMMIRNYAKQSCGFFTRMAGKIAAMTFMQYVNFVNHRPIGQIKYSLI